MKTESQYINTSGHLDVGDGHKIYWEDWGNSEAAPSLHLHGGPGSSFSDDHKRLYDPFQHRVIFFDQRGCGRSLPFAETKHNTTADLIADIERLRNHLGLETINVVGGSWGSALALLYAIAHPDRVSQLVLWSIYLARQFENDWVNEGYPRYQFPAEWSRFIALVPPENRTNGDSIMKYYAQQLQSVDASHADKYAFEWTLWESTLSSINYDPQTLTTELSSSRATTSVALFETHYLLNKCFIPENYILDNIKTITSIPCAITHGRFDMCTPALNAQDLAMAYGKNAQLNWVNSGHHRTDPEMFTALQKCIKDRLI